MGGYRNFAIGLGALGALAALILLLLFRPFATPANAQGPGTSGATYVGVATCGGTTCHGRSRRRPGRPAGRAMLWQDPATAAAIAAPGRCFANRGRRRSPTGSGSARQPAPDVPGLPRHPGRTARRPLPDVGRSRLRKLSRPASGWLSSHYVVGGTHANNVSRGLIPLDNPRARAAQCLDCHFGSAGEGQFVTHRIMAAGHPRISFELDLFSTLQQHYNLDNDYFSRKGRANSTQVWAIGQAMALDRSLSLFTTARGTEGMFPEFYFLDCHSCHRQISDDPRFRPSAQANPGRPIPSGMPPYNDENMIMLSAAARLAAIGLAARFERDSRAFHAAMATDRPSAVAAAQTLRQSARALADAFSGADFSTAATFRIIDTITTEAIRDRFTDYAGSVQAVMATDTLLSSLVNQGRVSVSAANSIRADINGAYRAVHDPNQYDPGGFRASLGRAAAAIRRLG